VSTSAHSIEVRGMPVEIVRKDIKNLHLGVYPPNGRVRVAAPLRLNDEAVRLAVITRLGWIRRQRARFDNQDRQSQREMVRGESHYVQGKRYRLDVIESRCRPCVRLRTNTIMELCIRPGSVREQREDVLNRWYRKLLRERVAELVPKWEPVIGVRLGKCGIRRMKTRWGTCNAQARRIWINLELAKKPPACLEYILVHELVHLLERHHNEQFLELMNRFMPKWRLYREELNRAPLSHESWSY
jgi:predicted metal-dependent hydrolase